MAGHVMDKDTLILYIRPHITNLSLHNRQLSRYVGGESEAIAWQKYLLVNKLDINTI